MNKLYFAVCSVLLSACDLVSAASATYCSGTTCYNVPAGSTINPPYGSTVDGLTTPVLEPGYMQSGQCGNGGSTTIYVNTPATYYPATNELVMPSVNVIGSPVTFKNVHVQFNSTPNVTHAE